MRAARAEVIDDRHRRARRLRSGSVPGADFVEQHQRRQRQARSIDDDVGDVRRERAEAGRDRLLVADVGEDATGTPAAAIRPPPGSCRPACAISGSRPAVFSATVLPPVFGPVMTSTRVGGISMMSTGTSAPSGSLATVVRSHARPTPGISSGWRAARSSRRPSVDERRLDAVDDRSRSAPSPAARRARSPTSTSRCRSSARRAERVGQRQQDAPDLLGLLLLERDDVVVDLDRAERLEKQARAARRAAVHDARNRGAVLGAHHQHVAAVALGDDLLLQVLRRVLAAQVRLERAAQPRALLAQPIADALQLAGSHGRRPRPTGRSCRRTSAISRLNDAAGSTIAREDRERRRARGGRPVRRRLDRLEEVGERERAAAARARGLRPRAHRGSRPDPSARAAGAPVSARKRAVSVVAASAAATAAASSAAAARRGAPRPSASARAAGPRRRCDRIRGPSGRRGAWNS